MMVMMMMDEMNTRYVKVFTKTVKKKKKSLTVSLRVDYARSSVY